MNQDFVSSTEQLADGFSALCDEYKLLAQQYSVLENKLSVATLEYESLRRLLPPNATPVPTNSTENVGHVIPRPGRNLDEWLIQMHEKSGSRDNKDSLVTIRDAEFACFKLRSKLGGDGRFAQRSGRASPGQPRRSSLQRSRPLSPIPMEQDFTVEKQPGQLGCPFASMSADKPVGRAASIAQSLNIPTPRGSGSHLGFNGRRSKRASFTDPIAPRIMPDDVLSPADSVASGGPACPIRFLDQHSPEEVAKYFEAHKHELPRSHEVCVKRFQTNSESIRELDAKYGNLVTMIQGLGQKHQSMLPNVPNADDVAEATEEQRSHRRVEKWAKAVSECAPIDANDDDRDLDPVVDEGEERLQRFDRDMKEIRLGESPSRPWGVTVPGGSKHHDDTQLVTQPQEIKEMPAPVDNDAQIPVHGAVDTTQVKAKGKCPFDHMALRSKAQQSEPSNKLPPHAPNTETQAFPLQQTEATGANSSSTGNKFVNRGIAIIANGAGLSTFTEFENQGTMIMGYDKESAKEILAAL